MGKKDKGKLFEQVEILDVAAEGKAIGRVNDKVVFTKYAAPGDIVDIRITKSRTKYSEGVVEKIHKYSDLRQEAFCDYFGSCGGCKWQHIKYEEQLKYKRQQVIDAFTRIGKLDFPEVKPTVGSNVTERYRNKMEYAFTDSRWLTLEEVKSGDDFDRRGIGFHVPGRFDWVIDIKECHLQDQIADKIRNAIRDFALENNIAFFNIKECDGQLRSIMIRNTSTNELMVLIQFFEDNDEVELVMNFMKSSFPEITSLNYVINGKRNDTFSDLEVHTFDGKTFIEEEMEGLKFRIGPKSFYQTNSLQAYELYKVTRELANIKETDVVYDLYTGTGTIANFVAKTAKKVIGVEYVEDAVVDARINSKFNEINNTKFYAGDMKDVLNKSFIAENGKPDVIITDPPRPGMHEDVVNTILRIAAPTVIYVSCNPATQARDLQMLEEKYKITAVQPVDMFPHTHHVENVVKLELK